MVRDILGSNYYCGCLLRDFLLLFAVFDVLVTLLSTILFFTSYATVATSSDWKIRYLISGVILAFLVVYHILHIIGIIKEYFLLLAAWCLVQSVLVIFCACGSYYLIVEKLSGCDNKYLIGVTATIATLGYGYYHLYVVSVALLKIRRERNQDDMKIFLTAVVPV